MSGFPCAYKITASAAAVICSGVHFVSVAWIRTGVVHTTAGTKITIQMTMYILYDLVSGE